MKLRSIEIINKIDKPLTINEIKNSLEGINSRITEAEEQISGLEGKIEEITVTEQNKEKRVKRIEGSQSQRHLGQH